MVYHHTKSGNKRLSNSEDIVQILTEIWNKLKFGTLTVTQGHSNPVFSLDTSAYDTLPSR